MPQKPPRTPQEKKRLSYQRDGRNAYGESDKGSRKSIANQVADTRRNDWKKSPDITLGEFVARQQRQRDLRQRYGRNVKDVLDSQDR